MKSMIGTEWFKRLFGKKQASMALEKIVGFMDADIALQSLVEQLAASRGGEVSTSASYSQSGIDDLFDCRCADCGTVFGKETVFACADYCRVVREAKRTGRMAMIGLSDPPSCKCGPKRFRFILNPPTAPDKSRTSSPAQVENSGAGGRSQASNRDLFLKWFTGHVDRVAALGGPFASFAKEWLSGDIVNSLAEAAESKMVLTQSSHQEAYVTISRPPVCYWLSTLGHSVDEARTFFGRTYGGYLKFIAEACNTDHVRGSAVLIHIIFSREKETSWVNMAIFPIPSQAQRFGIKAIFPFELLSEDERRLAARKPQ